MSFEITVQTHRGAEEWPWRCRLCGARHERWQRQCASCRTFDALKKGRTDEVSNSRALCDTPDDTTPPVVLRGLEWLNRFLGSGLPARSCWLLAGPPGGGKTTLAMQVCAAWPRADAPLWVSTEQPHGRVASYARRLGVRGDTVLYGNESEVTTAKGVARLALEHRARLVVVDSVQGLDPGAVLWLNRWAYRRNACVVLVSQVNAEGDAAGGPRPRHEASMVARLARVGEDKASPRRVLALDKSQHSDRDGTELELVKGPTGALAPG